MARTPNYGYEKRRRELERKAKKEAKAKRKEEQQVTGDPEATPADQESETPPAES